MLQTTIKNPVKNIGIGLHKGSAINISFSPLDANCGIVFKRSDCGEIFKADCDNVINTQMATVIGNEKAQISTIEHLMSAISAFGIDNMLITLDANEIPVLDGSAAGWCDMLKEAGICELDARKKVMLIKKEIKVSDGAKFAKLKPTKKPIFDFTIDFKHPSIGVQKYIYEVGIENYIENIASARTFGFLRDVEYLKSIGLALGGSLENAVVLDDSGILNPEGLRFSNEFVRHKILDAIGDLRVLSSAIYANYEAFASSHDLNHKLTLAVLADANAYEMLEIDSYSKDLLKAWSLN